MQVVRWKTLPPLITSFAEQSPSSEQGKSMQQSQVAHAAGDSAWDCLPPHAVPKGDQLVCPEGAFSCRSSSSAGAVPKKAAWDSGDTRDTCLWLAQKLWLNRVAGKSREGEQGQWERMQQRERCL